ncbi:D-alanyl-D-alanine carboxypeptidase/D-alanyl-D-alanine endopeptidase [Bergeriella denitrificans]|uniref:Penicillin-binding protein 3 n=1 Tax=Bergeriella denitrificans TaxID=494 RepID=A0A378UDR6_BERDE|nr:penicillin-binding protein 3 [Bergeriella denitrificans]
MNILPRLAALLLGSLVLPAAALDFRGIPQGEIAVYVQELESGRVVVAHRENASVNPASAMKLVTAFAALRALGENYRWPTDWGMVGEVKDGTLEGDLYWVGSGNPVLQQEDIAAVQARLRDMGIRNIRGHLVFDRSLWGKVGNSPDFAADAAESYMVAPDPNMLAYKVVWLKPERDGRGGVQISTKPALPAVTVDNRLGLNTLAQECRALGKHMKAVYTGGVLRVSGSLPESCLGQEMFVNMLEADDFAYRSFANAWRLSGGGLSDGLKTGRIPQEARLLVRQYSPPLKEMLTEMNKHSSNLIARSVYLKLGGSGDAPDVGFANLWRWSGGGLSADLPSEMLPYDNLPQAGEQAASALPVSAASESQQGVQPPTAPAAQAAKPLYLQGSGGSDAAATLVRSEAAVRHELAAAGIDTRHLVLENGSGLSRKERVTAKMLAQVLEKAYFSPFGNAFIQTLPVAGVDGTLKSRLKNAGSALRLKTGTLGNVRALAGYWLGSKPMIVVVVINSPKAGAYLDDMDALVSQIAAENP